MPDKTQDFSVLTLTYAAANHYNLFKILQGKIDFVNCLLWTRGFYKLPSVKQSDSFRGLNLCIKLISVTVGMLQLKNN